MAEEQGESGERERHAEQLLAAVNEAAAAVSTRFVTFVSVGAYVAVTVASTTHEMLLRASNLVTLPLLGVQIPIVGAFGFYTIAPWLVLLLHSDLLLQLSILDGELGRFEEEAMRLAPARRSLLRQRVANFYYVLYFTGAAPSRFLHLLSGFITWMTAVAIPLGLLLWIQIRFLPFHSPFDTWLHRAAVTVDAALIAVVLLPRLRPRLAVGPSGWRRAIGRLLSVPALVAAACVVVVCASLFVATIPSGPGGNLAWFARNMDLREQVLTGNALDPEEINALRDAGTPEALRGVLQGVTPLRALQGRDLRYANLFNAVLPLADLRAAGPDERDPVPESCAARRGCEDPPDCEVPELRRTQLAGANFAWSSMQGAMLNEAVLDDARLDFARLQEADFERARLNRATLAHAKLQGVKLAAAKLCGADMRKAGMENADLTGAFLRGALLPEVNLRGAKLERADLRGADLSAADLTGANLGGALLQGATLRGAKTDGASFAGANLELADLAAAGGGKGAPDASALHAYLSELACSQASVAHGVARQALESQALESPARNGPELARALLDAAGRPGCAGVGSLPRTVRAELRNRARGPRAR